MAEQRFKITNNTKHHIGIKRPSGAEDSIAPGLFVYLNLDEIAYNGRAMEKWLKNGTLTCEDETVYDTFGGKPSRETMVVAMSNDEIKTKLHLPMGQFTKWLNSLTDEGALRKVFEAAVADDDLPVKKLDMIDKKTGFSYMDARRRRGEGA